MEGEGERKGRGTGKGKKGGKGMGKGESYGKGGGKGRRKEGESECKWENNRMGIGKGRD